LQSQPLRFDVAVPMLPGIYSAAQINQMQITPDSAPRSSSAASSTLALVDGIDDDSLRQYLTRPTPRPASVRAAASFDAPVDALAHAPANSSTATLSWLSIDDDVDNDDDDESQRARREVRICACVCAYVVHWFSPKRDRVRCCPYYQRLMMSQPLAAISMTTKTMMTTMTMTMTCFIDCRRWSRRRRRVMCARLGVLRSHIVVALISRGVVQEVRADSVFK
jgi:hypothetical protein